MGAATGAAGVPAHGDSLLLLLDVLKELDGAVQLPAVDGLSGLAGVLERNTQVRAAGAGRLGRLNLGSSVSDLFIEKHDRQRQQSALSKALAFILFYIVGSSFVALCRRCPSSAVCPPNQTSH